MTREIRQWFLGKKTRKNTSKIIDEENKRVYNINIKSNQAKKKGNKMFTREKWECFYALESYLKQKGINLDIIAGDEVKMNESATIYVFWGADIEGVEIVKGNMRYFVPLLEYNSEVDELLPKLELRGFSHDRFTWKEKEYYILTKNL